MHTVVQDFLLLPFRDEDPSGDGVFIRHMDKAPRAFLAAHPESCWHELPFFGSSCQSRIARKSVFLI